MNSAVVHRLAVPGVDQMTVLSSNLRLTKLWKADGTIDGYGDAKWYTHEVENLASFDDMAKVLSKLAKNPNKLVIRGLMRDVDETDTAHLRGEGDSFECRRTLKVFKDAAHRWMLVDIDSYVPMFADCLVDPVGACVEAIENTLPECFHNKSFFWQLSSSAGSDKAKAEGTLKAHLWFWLQTPYEGEVLEFWAKYGNGGGAFDIDATVYRQVQPNYTANPVFDEGAVDPVVQRFGVFRGLENAVDLAIDTAVIEKAKALQNRKTGKADSEISDPADKPGLIGLFDRTYDWETVISDERFIPGEFTFDNEAQSRLTWSGSSTKTPGGCWITPDGYRMGNGYNSAPKEHYGTAVSKFDLVRIYKFGHLDAEVIEAEVDEQDDPYGVRGFDKIGNSPKSLHEMLKFVATLEEIRLEQAKEDTARVRSYLDLISSAVTGQELRDVCDDVQKDRALDDFDRSNIADALVKAFKSVEGIKLTVAEVKKKLRFRSQGVVFPHVGPDLTPHSTIENVQAVLDGNDVTYRYNVVSKRYEFRVPELTYTLDNEDNSVTAAICSLCAQYGITSNKVIDYACALADKNPYNPVLEWVKSKPWDGTSRLQEFYNTVELRDEADESQRELKAVLMRKWAVTAIKAVMNEQGVKAEGMLVLQGAQGQGKGRWLLSLVSDKHWVRLGHLLDPNNKDSIMTAVSHWLVELGELDGTFRKSDIASLKAFTTLEHDVLRKPYARADSRYARRTVFYASVNDEMFLNDKSGNRRFWTLPVNKVYPDHKIDTQQLWAELAVLAESGEIHWLTPSELDLLNKRNEAFTAATSIDEKVSDYLSSIKNRPHEMREMTATQIYEYLTEAKATKNEPISTGRALASAGLKRRMVSNVSYWSFPMPSGTDTIEF